MGTTAAAVTVAAEAGASPATTTAEAAEAAETAEDTARTTDLPLRARDGSAPNVAKYEVMSDNLHRHDVWGDDPEERDASDVVAEISSVDPEVARRWHDHPAVVPFKVVALFIVRNGRRIAITVVGIVVLVAGLALLVLPGPGWLLIFVGLSILGTEYVWAQRLLRVAKQQANNAKDKVLRRKQAKADRREAASSDGPDVS